MNVRTGRRRCSPAPGGGNGAFEASFEGASADGTRVFFVTEERLVGPDTDTVDDIYVKRIVPPVNTARPTISGTPLVGRRLTCSPGTWGNNPTRLAYRWNRAGVAISGATTSGYTLVTADGGRPITCTVTATNGAGSRSATSVAVTARIPGPCANPQTGNADRTGSPGSPSVTGWSASAATTCWSDWPAMTACPAAPATTRSEATPAWTASTAGPGTTRSRRAMAAGRLSTAEPVAGTGSPLTVATGSSAANG